MNDPDRQMCSVQGQGKAQCSCTSLLGDHQQNTCAILPGSIFWHRKVSGEQPLSEIFHLTQSSHCWCVCEGSQSSLKVEGLTSGQLHPKNKSSCLNLTLLLHLVNVFWQIICCVWTVSEKMVQEQTVLGINLLRPLPVWCCPSATTPPKTTECSTDFVPFQTCGRSNIASLFAGNWNQLWRRRL